MSDSSWLAPFLGRSVIADCDGGYLVIGTLMACDGVAAAFADADVHDHAEANCTKEIYAIESRQIGVRANRRKVTVPQARIIAISLLEDVIA
jgi:hypothetical protein